MWRDWRRLEAMESSAYSFPLDEQSTDKGLR